MSSSYLDKKFRREAVIITIAGILAVIDMSLLLIGIIASMK